ncbi:probable ubiquitin-conjugating enzyme E2 23 isoform X1 [Syzygium oleosum]|uniref:probable ubiquitin-conjugating enzyme E2 23 isoform X1 n=1 Tax=Syzygium oleosum TaxID=219896 RepID=UPI0024BAAE86|nr:probable ubiquitin-conjugating enzyme E2 23 isoform X1 [Syzygium oleosum]
MALQQKNIAAEEPTTSGHDTTLEEADSAIGGCLSDVNNNGDSNGMAEADRNIKETQSFPGIYRQDVVRSKKNGTIGIVTEVAGDSDSDGSITDEEDEDEDDEDDAEDSANEETDGDRIKLSRENCAGSQGDEKPGPLSADQVRVLWMNDIESTQSLNEVTVIDRGFLHGDYVASALDPTGQIGVVVDVSINVDVSTYSGSTIEDIPSRELKRVTEFSIGDYVVLGPWLGRVDGVLDNVTVQFDDGSVCKVMKAEPHRLKPITKNLLEDEHCTYFPGQRVKASSSSIFKNSRWLSGLWKANKLEGTVTKVTIGSVFIYWIASAGHGPDSSTAPAEEQSPKKLKLLSCFSHANWQLGDWCLLPSSTPASSLLYKGLSRLELDDSLNSELDSSQPEKEVALDESIDNREFMDTDADTVLDPKAPLESITRYAASSESSSCSSSLSVAKETLHEPWPLHRKKIRKVVLKRDKKIRRKEENFEKALQIVNTRTKVDVAWQDGQIERCLDSTKLIPIETPGDHEFVAEQYVVEKAADDEDYAGEVRRVGVVKSVNAKERTARVNWLKPVARPEDTREFEKEEVVSVYELEGHPDYDYCYGDVVVRLSPVSASLQMDSGMKSIETGMQQSVPEEDTTDNEEDSLGTQKVEEVTDNEATSTFTDLSWVGNITGLKDGDIEVTWADGMVSTVGPQAIYVVGRDDDDASIASGSGVSDAASWETVDDDEMDAVANDKEEVGLANDDDNDSGEESVENHTGMNSALSFPLAAIGFVTRLATGIFSRGRKNLDSGLDSEAENDSHSQMLMQSSDGLYSSDECSSQKSNIMDCTGTDTTYLIGDQDISGIVPDPVDAAESLRNTRPQEVDAPASYEETTCTFKRFDTARDPLDHYFIGTNGQVNGGRKWFKKVQQDWNILQNNLPDGIYVRVYEDRMDLVRAVIVGAYATPYQDGLFFFDFHLPPEYPDVPPSAYYHSGGWRINPNLYEEGKVCLSLLNTWTGRGNEVWDPLSSSILQVLVSLQGLVLNSKPYFNEAGYDKQIGTAEGEKNSLAYNENTFLLNCKTMLNLMRKPPKDFEDLVKEHFQKRGFYILKACDAYMKGYLIGSLTKDASVSSENNANSTSVGFKLMLAKIVPKLLLALDEAGADCNEFRHLGEP